MNFNKLPGMVRTDRGFIYNVRPIINQWKNSNIHSIEGSNLLFQKVPFKGRINGGSSFDNLHPNLVNQCLLSGQFLSEGDQMKSVCDEIRRTLSRIDCSGILFEEALFDLMFRDFKFITGDDAVEVDSLGVGESTIVELPLGSVLNQGFIPTAGDYVSSHSSSIDGISISGVAHQSGNISTSAIEVTNHGINGGSENQIIVPLLVQGPDGGLQPFLGNLRVQTHGGATNPYETSVKFHSGKLYEDIELKRFGNLFVDQLDNYINAMYLNYNSDEHTIKDMQTYPPFSPKDQFLAPRPYGSFMFESRENGRVLRMHLVKPWDEDDRVVYLNVGEDRLLKITTEYTSTQSVRSTRFSEN